MAEGFLYKPLLQDEDKKYSLVEKQKHKQEGLSNQKAELREQSQIPQVDTTFPSEMRNHQNDSTCLLRI